jgi:hypothetical protein
VIVRKHGGHKSLTAGYAAGCFPKTKRYTESRRYGGGYNYDEKLPWLHGESRDETKRICMAYCMIPRRSRGWNKMLDHNVENTDHKRA